MDVSGAQQFNVDTNLKHQKLSKAGEAIDDSPLEAKLPQDLKTEIVESKLKDGNNTICGSCYGAESSKVSCCNSCDEVRAAYSAKGWAFHDLSGIDQCKSEGKFTADDLKPKASYSEGCRIHGYIEVNKVGGNFHIAPGKSFQQSNAHIHDMQMLSGLRYNTSHHFTHLSFGKFYPDMTNPLDNTTFVADASNKMFQYYMKLVPTTYIYLDGSVVETNQYSVTKHEKTILNYAAQEGLPGVFVNFEFSPIKIQLTVKQRSFMHFLTSACAIIGGVFTVASLLDSCIYRSVKVLRKMELNKYT